MRGLNAGTDKGLGVGPKKGLFYGMVKGLKSNTDYCYQAETLAWFYQLANPKPSFIYLAKVDNLIRSLKEFGIWNQLDRFWIFATEQQAHARVSLVNPQGVYSSWPTNIVEHANPTWTRLKGYTGNGSAYLDTGYNPNNTGANNYQLNSASFGVYSLTNTKAQNQVDIGNSSGSNKAILIMQTTTPDSRFEANNALTATSYDLANTNGLVSGLRNNATSVNLYYRGALVNTTSVNSSAIPNLNMYILAVNAGGTPTDFSTKQLAMAFIGNGSINQSLLYQLLQSFAMLSGFYV